MPQASPTQPTPRRSSRFAGKLGVGLFLFFLIKGLLWLIIPALAGLGLMKSCSSATTVS